MIIKGKCCFKFDDYVFKSLNIDPSITGKLL